MSWQLQEAKQKFSELVRRTLEEGPQVVTRHGEEVVVVVPAEEFRRTREKKPDFKEYLMSAPEGLEHIVPERPPNDRGTWISQMGLELPPGHQCRLRATQGPAR